jgi:hypothetical protein
MPGASARRLPAPGASVPGASAISPSGQALVHDPILGAWEADNAVLVPGFRGGKDYVLASAAYRSADDTDLLLHFDAAGGDSPVDLGGRWTAKSGPSFRLDREKREFGDASASFRGASSAISLFPGRGALLEGGSRFRDFSIEFWLYPATAENGEVILSWQSIRTLGGASLPQELSCAISGGRVTWSFQNFFDKPLPVGKATAKGATPERGNALPASRSRLELRAADPLVPKAWSHHLLRFDGDTGLLEYVVDGVTEAAVYATSTGHEGGDVYSPAVGAAAALTLGSSYGGLMDEFRISRSPVSSPALQSYGRDPGLVLSPVVDLGVGNSRLASVDLVARTPGATGIELSYRISDEWAGWRFDSPEWIPFRPGEGLPGSARGRYVQIRADLYPDGTGRVTPSLSSLVLHYEQDPLPPPPARLVATAKDGAVELRWSRVPDADVAGYLVYYGGGPGEYYGAAAAEGPSPIDVGKVTSITISGLPNGSLVYFAVATYDAAILPGKPESRAGEFSAEVSARPLRTAR